MRLNAGFLLLLAAALVLAESQPGGPATVEVHSSNNSIEIAGSDSGEVKVSDSSQADIREEGGLVVVRAVAGPLRLSVPRQASLEVIASNGAIHVTGMNGVLRLQTSNGAIVVRDSAAAEVHARSSNGPIDIAVPAGLHADLSAHTSNGQIHCDLTLEPQRLGATFLEGKIGGGGAPLDLQTSNGPIYLRNSSQQEVVDSVFKPGEVR